MEQLPSAYDPAGVEAALYARWRERGYFDPDGSSKAGVGPKSDASAPTFTCVLPPPNVTGRLHMGHALTATIEDCLVRWHRMRGYAALWLPGTDHAGIATQVMVERQLEKEGTTRQQVGRDEFLRRTWQWKDEHGGIIDRQHEALGASLDWSRYRFTMDEVSSRAVREAFCRLYDEGLIYRAYRLINWDWASQTALSDLEVEHRETEGKLWHIAYPVEGESVELVVATTRPETMLGDTAVAVHPDDPRYKHLIGKQAKLPLTDRTIPIVGDAILVDMEFGTGAVKVTPGHDFNDFETGKRHSLPVMCVLDLHGRMNDEVPQRFRGLPVADARTAVLDALAKEGFLRGEQPHKLSIGHSQRTGVVVEPIPSTQWFVNVAPMAEKAIAAVRGGDTVIVPTHRTNDYFRWMENIHDWCISRQLWWGHRIPAWYCDDGHVTVGRTDPTKCGTCGKPALRQDDDVLDTWFSSGLWPLTTLGWPDRDADVQRFYPTSLMETGWDILFFWVARMMMFGLHFTGKVPFRTVFLHSMVLGEDGQKMSKTKGNVVDPVELIDRYGADALRFYLCTMAGQDLGIVFSRARVEGYRHFCNKLWNAARFVGMHVQSWDPQPFHDRVAVGGDVSSLSTFDRWILGRCLQTTQKVDEHLAEFRLDLAAHAAYQFVWYELCDWYIEAAKKQLRSGDEAQVEATRGTLALVFDVVLRALHPLVPFVTEAIWTSLPKVDRSESLMIAAYPRARAGENAWDGPVPAAPQLLAAFDDQVAAAAQLAMDITSSIRAQRGLLNIPPGKTDVEIIAPNPEMVAAIAPMIAHLSGTRSVTAHPAGHTSSGPIITGVVGAHGVNLLVGDFFTPEALATQRTRLQKTYEKQQGEIAALSKRLSTPGFRDKAPADAVAEAQRKLDELRVESDKLAATLRGLA